MVFLHFPTVMVSYPMKTYQSNEDLPLDLSVAYLYFHSYLCRTMQVNRRLIECFCSCKIINEEIINARFWLIDWENWIPTKQLNHRSSLIGWLIFVLSTVNSGILQIHFKSQFGCHMYVTGINFSSNRRTTFHLNECRCRWSKWAINWNLDGRNSFENGFGIVLALWSRFCTISVQWR